MRGKIKDIIVGIDTTFVTLAISKAETEGVQALGEGEIEITLKRYRERRTRDANALMWACLAEIAAAINSDKWAVYLRMLRRYGKFTHICVKPEAVDAIRKQWRESEIVGDITINGKPAVQMLCYYGSSTYDSKEFSVLLDGIISEMREMGLTPPPSEEMSAALERWNDEKHNTK